MMWLSARGGFCVPPATHGRCGWECSGEGLAEISGLKDGEAGSRVENLEPNGAEGAPAIRAHKIGAPW